MKRAAGAALRGLVHPAVFAFAAWDHVREQQTEQQTNTQHAAAIHKPLHDDGALFIVDLNIGGVHFLLRHDKLVFELLVLIFQAVDDAIARRDFFCISAVR